MPHILISFHFFLVSVFYFSSINNLDIEMRRYKGKTSSTQRKKLQVSSHFIYLAHLLFHSPNSDVFESYMHCLELAITLQNFLNAHVHGYSRALPRLPVSNRLHSPKAFLSIAFWEKWLRPLILRGRARARFSTSSYFPRRSVWRLIKV